jgi:hypothetical protein
VVSWPAKKYTVVGSNSCGSYTTSVTIGVKAIAPTSAHWSGGAEVVDTVNNATTQTPSVEGDPITSWTVTPRLPAGLHLNTDHTYIGCFHDNGARDMKHYTGSGFDQKTCAKACKGYTYFALQYGGQCFCDNTYSTPPAHTRRLRWIGATVTTPATVVRGRTLCTRTRVV